MSVKLASSELDSRDLAKKKTHFGYWKIFSSENTRQTFEFEQYLNDHWILHKNSWKSLQSLQSAIKNKYGVQFTSPPKKHHLNNSNLDVS
jgi:hypothetical protein